MSEFEQYYTTLTEVKRQLGTTSTSEDTMLSNKILGASAAIQALTGRSFVPYQETRYLRRDAQRGVYTLELDTDLLAVNTLTDPDATVLSSTDYDLLPLNTSPKWAIELTYSGAKTWNFSTHSSKVTIDGIWGYHHNYARAWGTQTTLTGTLDASGTLAAVSSISGFEIQQYALIGTEQVRIAGTAAGTLTLVRGENGTTAGAHGTVTVSIFRPVPAIYEAATRMTVWLYQHRDTVQATYETVAGVIRVASDLTDEVNRVRAFERVRISPL